MYTYIHIQYIYTYRYSYALHVYVSHFLRGYSTAENRIANGGFSILDDYFVENSKEKGIINGVALFLMGTSPFLMGKLTINGHFRGGSPICYFFGNHDQIQKRFMFGFLFRFFHWMCSIVAPKSAPRQKPIAQASECHVWIEHCESCIMDLPSGKHTKSY